MFSFFQSAPDPALLRVGKCPSWWHTHPSRGCTSHPWCPEETQTSSRCYKLNRCPARRKKNPLLHRRHPPPHHHHLLPLPAVTPVQARTKLESWNSLGLKFGKKEALGLSRSCQWPSVWGSSSFETSEESELNKKEEKKRLVPLVHVYILPSKYENFLQNRFMRADLKSTNWTNPHSNLFTHPPPWPASNKCG